MLFRQHVETTIDQQGRHRHLKSRRPSASSFENQNFINSKEQRRRNSNYLTTSRANNSRLAAINQFESIDSTISKQQQQQQQQQVSSMQATLCNERLRPDYQPDEVQPDNMTTTTRLRSINASQHNHLVRHSKSCLLINNIKMSPNLTAAKMVLYSLTVGLLLLNSIPQDNQVLGHRNAPNNSTTTTRHDHLHPIETERHFQLLRSANVELNRRSLQRPQREAGTGADQAGSAPAPTCGYPGSPAHASVTFNTTHVVAGTAASYACDNGYELLGPPRRICQGNGTWSPVGIPFCVLNVGLGKAAMQSSTAGHGSAQKAVDGSTSPYYQASTCTMTDVESNPWWYVNLLEPYLVQIVRIDFGTACCAPPEACNSTQANRQKATIAVRVGNNRPDLGNNPLCNRYHGFIEEGKPLFLPCTRPAPGAFVSIHLEAPSGSSLSICETFIYTDHALSIEQCPSFRDQPLGSTATYNGKCYLFHNNQALSFDSARKYCESRGGTLVDETSPALQGFLSWELYRRHRNDQLMGQYWLGAVRDTRNQQNWKWINGKDVQISFWNSLGSQGNCSRFDGSKGWLWSDTDCQANLNFICQYRPLSCGKPEKPTNSTLITKNVDNGTVIEYQCAPGNLLMGPKSRACLPTGFFSEFAPKCKYLDCQFPAGIDNGSYKLLNRTTSYLSVVNYFCQEGYQMLGKPTLTCDVDERWNGPPPRCEPLLCPAPVAPSNGFVTVTSNMTIAGTQATYDCRPGYELVGDRLLTCQQSGSWDNSFPYCREKRQIFPHTLHGSPLVPGQPSGTPTVSVTPSSSSSSSLSSTARPPVASTSARPKPQVGAVQFPSAGASSSGFSSNRLSGPTPTSGATSTASPPTTSTTTTTTTTSLPTASLNGLAGQFVSGGSGQSSQQQQQQPSSLAVTPGANEIIPLVAPQPANQNEEPQQRKPAQSSSVSQFVLPELSMAPMRTPVPSSSSSSSSPSSPSQSSPSPAWPPPRQSIGPQQQQQPLSPLPQPTAGGQPNQAANNRQSNQKFSFNSQSPSVVMSTTGSQLGYDSSPLATTNSISVHPTSTSASNQQPGNLLSTMQPPQTTTTINHQHHQHSTGAGNVLASFSPTPVRSHNTLANAKYSLDGIIAVAIFGGFIFLGAIITILVIIIRRRKSSQSSTIDAQTISTYDSNGEHNGLYRNYQQAWENLRFAGPNGQPKSSGNGAGGAGGGSGVSLITAHVSGGPSVGLKNYASPAALLQHPVAPGLHHQLHGHHNMAMSSASSSQSNSSLGGGGAPGSGGGDPLLGHQHLGSHMHHQHSMSHHHHHNHHLDDEDEDEDDVHRIHEDDEDEQGVISADEANYLPSANRPGHHHAHHAHHHHLSVINQSGEGFRDSNELTINADTALMSNMSDVNTNNQLQSTGSSGNLAARRRLYSTNSIGRSMASVVANRRSMGNMSGSAGQHHVHPTSATGGGQHQRLVSSSTSSTSTHSSRASPPSTDDHSLDRLAYGNNWQATSTGAEAATTTGNKQQASGSGIARANLRYS